MKTLMLLTVFSITSQLSWSQTSAYLCPQTGAMGYCYDVLEPKACAYDAALSYGAVAPQLILNTVNKGYGAVAIGTNNNGIRVFGISAGYNSPGEAKSVARNACINRGGRNVSIQDAWLDI